MLYRAFIENNLDKEKIILTDKECDYTYMQLHKSAMAILGHLRRQGAKKGDRVLIRSHNDGRTVSAILACLAGGMIFVPISDKCKGKEVDHIRQDCLPSVFFDSQETGQAAWNIKNPAQDERALITGGDGAYILYTSGTEGVKKGVFACQKQINFCCKGILSRLQYRESDKVLCCLPLEFDYGLYQIFLSLLSGARMFLMDSRIIQMIPRWIYEWNITVYPSTSTTANLLVRLGLLHGQKLGSLRCITFTGEYLPVELIKELKDIMVHTDIIPMYGITECKRVAIMPAGREDKVLAGSCGLPLDGVKVYIDKKRAEDTEGELVVVGPNVMEGYWNSSNSGFEVDSETGVRKYHTGDVMSIDKEGFLYFHDRKNGLVKPGGIRVSEAEVEHAVREAEGVIECAAVGIYNSAYGEKLGICIYIRDMKMWKHIEETVSKIMVYGNIYKCFPFCSSLPRNQNGKIDKLRLREMIYEKEKYISGK